MSFRHLARILFCSALASLVGTYMGILLFGWLTVLAEAVEWGEALASVVYMPFAAVVGAVIVLPHAFPTACALAVVAGGLLWRLGRRRAWARRRTPWVAAGMLCGLIEAVRLFGGFPSLQSESRLDLGLPAAAAGAGAALFFRAAMPLLPPYSEAGEDGGWDP